MVKRRTDGDFVRLALKRSLVREAGIVGLVVGDWVGSFKGGKGNSGELFKY